MNIDDFPFDELVHSGQTQKELLEAITDYLGEDEYIWDVVDAYVALGLLDEEFSSKARNAAGYIWCPYIPLQTTASVVAASSFTPSAGVMTRYGKAINSGLYKTVNIGTIPTTTTTP